MWETEIRYFDLVCVKPATDDLRDVCKMKKNARRVKFVRNKGRAQDDVKIIYIRFVIRLFSRTIILSLVA